MVKQKGAKTAKQVLMRYVKQLHAALPPRDPNRCRGFGKIKLQRCGRRYLKGDPKQACFDHGGMKVSDRPRTSKRKVRSDKGKKRGKRARKSRLPTGTGTHVRF